MVGYNVCEICKERLVGTQDGYKSHLIRFHSIKSAVRPERTTNRTKAQIVFDMEKLFGYAVLPTVKPWHLMEVR